MNSQIDVQRARVQALAAHLMTTDKPFDSGCYTRCYIGHMQHVSSFRVALRFERFADGMLPAWSDEWHIRSAPRPFQDFFGLSFYDTTLHSNFINSEGRRTHRSSAFHAGVRLLEAVGLCGPMQPTASVVAQGHTDDALVLA